MALIAYHDLAGKTVVVKNPTAADYDAYFDVWKARNGEAFRREFVRQMVEQNSTIMKMIPRIEGAL